MLREKCCEEMLTMRNVLKSNTDGLSGEHDDMIGSRLETETGTSGCLFAVGLLMNVNC